MNQLDIMSFQWTNILQALMTKPQGEGNLLAPSFLRAESNGVVGPLAGRALEERIATRLVVGVGVRVGAV
jgi:hypothetical protein